MVKLLKTLFLMLILKENPLKIKINNIVDSIFSSLYVVDDKNKLFNKKAANSGLKNKTYIQKFKIVMEWNGLVFFLNIKIIDIYIDRINMNIYNKK